MQTQIQYRKIGGEWLLSSPVALEPGATVTVTLRSGRTKQETIAELALSGATGFFYKPAPRTAPLAVAVGELNGLYELFDTARRHLRFPKVRLSVPDHESLLLSVAGPRAKVPGSISIVGDERGEEGRKWYGRISRDGTYQPSATATAATVIAERLRELAARPAETAAAFGRLTGRCCFCSRHLEDARSTSVGYGPDCAEHYGLPWGASH